MRHAYHERVKLYVLELVDNNTPTAAGEFRLERLGPRSLCSFPCGVVPDQSADCIGICS